MTPSFLPLATCAATLATLATFTTSEAQAATRYGVACIHNRTQHAINFDIKVGKDGSWTSYRLQPGWNRSFSHKYDKQNENQSPPIYIRFDSDLRGKTFWTEYKLERRAASGETCEEGKPYNFRYERNNQDFIDLKASS
ncbi:hypothetical protein K9U40_15850 [Xanthobacter autotrophicus]|uniref:hypothetical protein n=1 Tax=Xanthobacter TaxID=279 RepID=UPI0024AC5926|nr:hypothetical protein [Xanthobacter autotrophicus]MDI4665785.1 hypothetical protein [Xanthobacter autotrophicus]